MIRNDRRAPAMPCAFKARDGIASGGPAPSSIGTTASWLGSRPYAEVMDHVMYSIVNILLIDSRL